MKLIMEFTRVINVGNDGNAVWIIGRRKVILDYKPTE
jgi:hypothetical protein